MTGILDARSAPIATEYVNGEQTLIKLDYDRWVYNPARRTLNDDQAVAYARGMSKVWPR